MADEVSQVKSNLAVQTEKVSELRDSLGQANEHITDITAQRDEFAAALTEQQSRNAILKERADRYESKSKKRFWIIVAMGALIAVLAYLLFKPS